LIQQIAFIAITAVCFFLFIRKLTEITGNIRLGRSLAVNNPNGVKNMLLLALGQKKMFQNFIPAILHGFIYVAFIITQVELIEIFADGFLGKHRLLLNTFGDGFKGFYTFVISFIEILSVFALIATFIFLVRRNLLKVPRFVMPEMKGWPKLDANLILLWEIWLVFHIFLMNGADAALYPGKYNFAITSNLIAPLLNGLSDGTLHFLERWGWWGHIVYFLDEKPAGQVENMPAIANEVKAMFDPSFTPPTPENGETPQKFGAKEVTDLTWKNLLDAYTCTECGRCSAACPASQTGKLLSPRKIMMDTRDRLEEISKTKKAGEAFDDGKSLLGDYISNEEIMACTSCNACVQECPVSINPLDIILQLRRYQILEASKSPEEWNVMFNNIENNQAPWQFSPSDRAKWTEELV